MLPDLPVTIELYEWLASKTHFGGCTAAHKKACMFTRFVASSCQDAPATMAGWFCCVPPRHKKSSKGQTRTAGVWDLDLFWSKKSQSLRFSLLFLWRFCEDSTNTTFKSSLRFQPSKIKYLREESRETCLKMQWVVSLDVFRYPFPNRMERT